MGRAHAVLEEVPAIGLPIALQVSGRDRDLVRRSADHRVISDPVRFAAEENCSLSARVSAVCHLFEQRKLFFAAAARIVQFHVGVVADKRKVAGVEKRAVVGEFGQFITVAEATALVAYVARKTHVSPGAKGWSSA